MILRFYVGTREPYRLRMTAEEVDTLERLALVASRTDELTAPESQLAERLMELVTSARGVARAD